MPSHDLLTAIPPRPVFHPMMMQANIHSMLKPAMKPKDSILFQEKKIPRKPRTGKRKDDAISCQNCRLAHVTCSYEQPCTRCVRLKKESCIYLNRKRSGRRKLDQSCEKQKPYQAPNPDPAFTPDAIAAQKAVNRVYVAAMRILLKNRDDTEKAKELLKEQSELYNMCNAYAQKMAHRGSGLSENEADAMAYYLWNKIMSYANEPGLMHIPASVFLAPPIPNLGLFPIPKHPFMTPIPCLPTLLRGNAFQFPIEFPKFFTPPAHLPYNSIIDSANDSMNDSISESIIESTADSTMKSTESSLKSPAETFNYDQILDSFLFDCNSSLEQPFKTPTPSSTPSSSYSSLSSPLDKEDFFSFQDTFGNIIGLDTDQISPLQSGHIPSIEQSALNGEDPFDKLFQSSPTFAMNETENKGDSQFNDLIESLLVDIS